MTWTTDAIEKQQEGPKWYDDRGEVVAFARYFWEGTYNYIGTTGEILDYFEEPWRFNEDYALYKATTGGS